MEIETPVNKRDLVRLKDKYGRVGKGYETAENYSFNVHNYNYISFIDPKVFYNTKKKFGRCSISLLKFKDDGEFRENFLSKNIELLFLFAIVWGLGIASIFKFSGFSGKGLNIYFQY